MSVNDGLSDEEWGAWGKPDETTVTPCKDFQTSVVKKTDNGFGSDDDLNFNKSENTNDNSNNGGEYKSKFSTNTYTTNNKFSSRKDDTGNRYNKGYNNNGDSRRGNYSDNKFNKDRNGDNNNRNNYRNNDDNRDRNGYQNKRDNYKRDDSDDSKSRFKNKDRKENYRDNSNENKTYNRKNFQRDNSDERKNNYRKQDGPRESRGNFGGRRNGSEDGRDNYKKCGDSRDDRRTNGRYRDDSVENRKTNDRYRDDSRENKRNNRYRDDSRGNRRNDDRNRDDSKENRRNRERYRDDSRENRRNNDRYRNNSREDRKNGDRYRGDSRENNRNNDRYRGDSREDRRRGDRYGDGSRENVNDRNRNFKRQESPELGNRSKKNQYGKNEITNYDDLPDQFDGAMQLDDKEGFSSRTFIRGKKKAELDTKTDDVAIPKRATFVPDDNQVDYELHVNSGINFDNYDKIPVDVTGENCPEPVNSFSDLALPEFLLENIKDLKYSKLTPVQKHAVPIISNKRDLMACAQTGSGKTAAFLIPIIKSLVDMEFEQTESNIAFPRALIMSPTRELCRQIFTVARHLCRGSKIRCSYIYGGIEMNKSRRNIQTSGCDILVATPGRLIHFLELVWISMRHLSFFVLDEADRMLDEEGFFESVNKIHKEAKCSGDERTIQISMFSATFPNEIQNLARNLLKNYIFLAVGVVGSANCDVKQEVILSDHRTKVNSAIDFIKTIPDEKTLIFVESKRMADFFGIKLGFMGFNATTIHGDREQEQRESALNDFKSGRVHFMVATNVAARGLDIPLVDNVINIDMPDSIDTYVHRIGRTGRCGNVGRAISFFDEVKDIGLASALVTKLQEANQEVPDWLKALGDGTGVMRSSNNFSRDMRKDVKMNKYLDNPNDDGSFMKGTNVEYDDAPQTSEWLED